MKASKENISAEILKKYFEGKLSAEERHQLEMRSLQDPFLADALEGYELFPDELNNLQKTQKEFSETKFKGNNASISTKVFLGIAASISILAVVYFTMPSSVVEADKNPVEEAFKELELIEITQDQQEVLEKVELPEITEDSDHEVEISLPAIPKSFSDKIEPMAQKIILEDFTEATKADKRPDKISKMNFQIDYVHELKIADYTKDASRISNKIDVQPKFNISEYSEMETKAAAKNKNSLSSEFTATEVPYNEFLSQTLKAFIKKDFGQTISNFKQILNKYPDDVNAIFYSGLCYFNLADYENAISQFKKAHEHRFNVFEEEALWYLALTYEKSGNTPEAMNLLQKIIQEDGFYSEKAANKLEQLRGEN
jgi:TolA-binding protein